MSASVRAALLDMRAALVERLARRFDGEALALLGTVGTALAAVDRAGIEAAPATHRVAVADRPDGIAIVFYSADGPSAEVPLDPHQVIALAGELIAVALPRFGAGAAGKGGAAGAATSAAPAAKPRLRPS